MAKAKKKVTKSAPAETRTRRVAVESNDNDSLIKKIIVVGLVLLGLYLLLNYVSGWQNNQDEKTADDKGSSEVEKSDDKNDDKADDKKDAGTDGASGQETDRAFTYTAQEGESYTELARRAVAAVDAGLTHAERVAAETKLTADANAEWLNEGQEVVFDKDTVRAAVSWAKSLPSDQKAVWQPYADLIAW